MQHDRLQEIRRRYRTIRQVIKEFAQTLQLLIISFIIIAILYVLLLVFLYFTS